MLLSIEIMLPIPVAQGFLRRFRVMTDRKKSGDADELGDHKRNRRPDERGAKRQTQEDAPDPKANVAREPANPKPRKKRQKWVKDGK